MRYEVTLPDGRRFQIEAPEGTAPDVLQREVEAAFASPQGQAPPAQDLPLPPPAGTTAGQRFMTGLADLPQGGAQFLLNNLPQGAVDAVNNATAWINRQPIIGPATRALGMVPATAEQVNVATTQREQDFRTGRAAGGLDPEGFDLPRLGGNVAGVVAASGPAMLMAPPATMAGGAALGATTGALLGATMPIEQQGDAYRQQLNENLRSGAMFGAGGGAAGNLLGRALAPRVNPQVQALADAGVEMTPGQIAGGGLRRFEDQLASFPLGIDAARRRGIEDFNFAVADRVLRPIGEQAPRNVAAGRELLNSTEGLIERAYQNALARVPTLAPDQQFAQDMSAVTATRFLTPSAQQEFQTALTERILPRIQGGPIDGQAYQTVTGELGRLTRGYQGSSDPAQRELAAAFRAARDAFEGLLQRAAPEAAERLQQANQAYAGLVRMQAAGGMQGATDGIFTPAQMSYAVRQNDPSLRRGNYARGDALLQDLSDAARGVLPSTVPDSGTAGRTLAGALAGGTAVGAVDPGVLGAYLAARLGYSRPVNSTLARALTAQRPAPVRAAGGAVARSGAPVAVPLGDYLLSPPGP